MIRRWWLAAFGACAVAAAVLGQGTIAGGVVWMIALAIACAGFGIAFERLTRQRVSTALTLAAGLAVLLAGSLVLARLGWLGRGAQLAAVAAGIAATGLPRAPRTEAAGGAGPGIAAVAVLGGGAALLLIALALIRPSASDDGASHAFLIKRLWDLGTLAGAHRSGLPIAGGAYAAWAAGASATSAFGAGCAALVIFLVAGELSAVETGLARLVLAVVALVVVLRPMAGAEWPAVVFHLAAILSLRGPIAERRIAWHTLLAAIALGLVRDEYWVLAAPYALAALATPWRAWPRARVAVGLAVWFCVAVAILLALGARAGAAAAKAVAILGGLPLAALVLRMLGGVAWRSVLGAMCAAVASYQLAIASSALPPEMHAAEAVFAIWFVVGVAGAIAVARLEPSPAAPWLRPAGAVLAIALIALTALGLPMFRPIERRAMTAPFTAAVAAWRDRIVFGAGRAADDVHAAQLRIPAGAAIAFWGHSAARLEFRRNPIRDVASDGGGAAAITEARLRALPWWIIEDQPIGGRRDPWSGDRARSSALVEASGRLELHDTIGSARVYRVRAPDAAAARRR